MIITAAIAAVSTSLCSVLGKMSSGTARATVAASMSAPRTAIGSAPKRRGVAAGCRLPQNSTRATTANNDRIFYASRNRYFFGSFRIPTGATAAETFMISNGRATTTAANTEHINVFDHLFELEETTCQKLDAPVLFISNLAIIDQLTDSAVGEIRHFSLDTFNAANIEDHAFGLLYVRISTLAVMLAVGLSVHSKVSVPFPCAMHRTALSL